MTLQNILDFFVGKKTYIIGTIAILYGFFFNDPNAIWIGLTAWGLKAGHNENTKQIIDGQ